MTDKLKIFVNRLSNIGIEVKLIANYPWIYLDTINGIKVKEKFCSEHGFTVAFLNQDFTFTDFNNIFKTIRKYGKYN